MPFRFDDTYVRLPERFYARVAPVPVRAPRLLWLNRPLAERLGADVERLASDEGAAILAGNVVPEGAQPIALAYAGHQFGSFVPRLGDGRAVLLGEVVGTDGVRRDVQLKGSGRTPFSRGGDGRAALGPVLREVIVAEAMEALGIPTTRSLAAVATGEPVARERVLPGAVLTRVARSHIRVGTFQYLAARDDREGLALLATYALDRHFPGRRGGESDALALLDAVVEGQASLVARWLGVGFVHGVMNTDNTSIACETIDYGPCAFLDEYDPGKRFSSIDHAGRYAFAHQPRIAQWNCARLAETLLPLLPGSKEEVVKAATARIDRFPALFAAAYEAVLRAKLGLVREREEDRALAEGFLDLLAEDEVDHTVAFRALAASAEDEARDRDLAGLFSEPARLVAWTETWRRRLREDEGVPGSTPAERAAAMRRANPAFIPRNHRIEEAIAAAEEGDLGPFEALMRVLARPFDDQPDDAHLAAPPAPEERVKATFCGT